MRPLIARANTNMLFYWTAFNKVAILNYFIIIYSIIFDIVSNTVILKIFELFTKININN